MANQNETLIENTDELLHFIKARTHAYHRSNLFLRDFHYAIIAFAVIKGQHVSYGKAEELAGRYIARLESTGILKPVKPGSWMLNFPAFLKQSSKPVPPARPAASPAGDKQPMPSIATSAGTQPATTSNA